MTAAKQVLPKRCTLCCALPFVLLQQYLVHAFLNTLHASVISVQVGKSYASAKEAIIMTGTFLLEQLQQMESAAGGKATVAFGSTAFVTALKSEVCLDDIFQILPVLPYPDAL